MFLCATSAQKDSNEAVDLTAAIFQNQLDEPIKVKKFEIELVSSVIRKDNKITITSPGNLLLFRLGPIDAGEMYSAEVREGIYTFADLAIEMTRALNDATPCNAWRGWSVTVNSGTGKFEVKFTVVATPAGDTTQLITEAQLLTRGGDITGYSYDSTNTRISFTPTYDDPDVLNASIDVRDNALNYITSDLDGAGASYFGLDVGNENVDTFFNTVTRDVGVFEGGGQIDYTISPTKVFVESDIYAPTAGNDVYLTLESDTDGTIYDPSVYSASFLGDQPNFHYTDDVGNVSNHSQINGILINPASNSNNEKRGKPYTRNEFTINFPPSSTASVFADRRQEFYRNSFTGNMIFRTTDTQPLPNRAFNINLQETPAEKASSTLKFLAEPKEKLHFRVANSPLIKGLQVKNADVIDSTNILQPAARTEFNGTKIRYIPGSVGRFNTRTFGISALAGITQGRLQRTGEADIYKMPVYRIDRVSATGAVEELVLIDGGEHIDITSSKGKLFLNDPNTFSVENQGTTSTADIVTELCATVEPTRADELGNQGTLNDSVFEFQYLPTEVGLVNDLIHQATQTGINDLIGSNPPYPCNYSKDIAVKIKPLSRANTTDKFVEFEIRQFQPDTFAFPDEGSITDFFANFGGNRNYDVLLLKARPGTWNTLTYTSGTAPANWSGSFTVPDADSRIKISLIQKGIYQQEIKCSFSTDAGRNFLEEILLLKTGDKVQGQVPSGPTFRKYEFTTKSRVFPLHPSISQYPKNITTTAGLENLNTDITGSFTEYNRNTKFLQGDKIISGLNGNYQKNLVFQSLGAIQPELLAPFPTTVGENHRPQLVLKTKTTSFTEVANGTAYPLSVGQIRQQEVQPNRGSLGSSIGLESVYTAEESFTSPVTFVGASAPTVIPELPSIAVEINNIPVDGYISKDYDVRDNQVGVGSRLPIVGVIPSLEDADVSNKPELHFRYNAPYSQPVVCDLPTETFLYNLSFRLREINNGKIVEGLKHPTELIFRVKNMETEKNLM